MKKQLFAVLLITLSLVVAGIVATACAPNGGNGGQPCCEATGTTDQPPPFAFTGGLAPTLQAQAVVFNGSACTTLDASGRIVNPASDYTVVGGPVPVVSTGGATTYGRYTMSIDQSAVGKQVYVQILGSGGVQSIGLFPVAQAAALPTGIYHLSPIRRGLSDNGESTTRAALLCWMADNGKLGSATSLDVREAIAQDDTVGVTGTAGFAGMANLVGAVAAAGQELENAAGPNFQPALHALRELAEGSVDECRDGIALDPGSGIKCQVGNDAAAELYRGWVYAWGTLYLPSLQTLPTLLPDLASAFAEEMELHKPPVGTAPSPFGYARRAEMLRLDAVAAGIAFTVLRPSSAISSGNLASVGPIFASERLNLLGAQGTPQVAAAASTSGSLIINALAQGNLAADTSCVLAPPTGGGVYANAQLDVSNTENALFSVNSAGTATVASILSDYYGAGGIQGALDTNLAQCATLSGPANAQKRADWAHLFTLIGLGTFAR